ncbi:hypothetical protein Y1Q_0002560 [Alligator mississippiensis]|uniref:Uncharacterized protein n=1 Tax=Alligator mississippiensis TaxID=8496 RepID=A0A151N3M0_ALLMI|nr:hypothetical protein Y1Q_0002560 [Alligator mississippiensis]
MLWYRLEGHGPFVLGAVRINNENYPTSENWQPPGQMGLGRRNKHRLNRQFNNEVEVTTYLLPNQCEKALLDLGCASGEADRKAIQATTFFGKAEASGQLVQGYQTHLAQQTG